MNVQNIIAEKFVFGGNCIGKIRGKTVFIPYAIPGEEYEVEITEEHRDFDRASIRTILEKSESRVEPSCPLYGKCGGCNMMHIEKGRQVELRAEVLSELLSADGIEIPEIKVVSGKNLGYRSRMQLNDGCFSERGGASSIKVERCPVLDDGINEWLSRTPQEERPSGRVQIFSHRNLREKTIVSKIQKPDSVPFKKKHRNERQARKIYQGTFISEENEANLEILGKNISFDVRGFFQSNIEVLEKAIEETLDGLKGSSALDMYSGAGTFSVFLADRFENLTLVEHNRDALVYAEKNLSSKKHESIGLSGAKWTLTKPRNDFDAAVVDPPRSGMEKEVLDYFCSSRIKKIRYVSCNPSTQARDVSRLVKSGYRIEKAALLDFYPNTSHIESLVCLSRN